MKLEFIELELDWPVELGVVDLRKYILSKLINYGYPLRWAITSLTTPTEKSIQKISIEALFIIKQDITKNINTFCK